MDVVYAVQERLGMAGFYLAIAVLVFGVLVTVHVLRRRGWRRTATVVAVTGLAVALGVVAAATLRPLVPPGEAARVLFLDPIRGAGDGYGHTVWRPVRDNVALFVPLGALLGAALPGRPRLPLWGLLVVVSVLIEVLQFAVPTGRVANTADVAANAVGGGLGLLLDRVAAGVAGLVPRRTSRRRRDQARVRTAA